MMPGIAIQPGLPIAGTPAARNASTAGGSRFSDALRGGPKDPDGAGDTTGRVAKQADGEEKKVDRSARAKDDRDGTEDEDGTKKDKDDRTGNALPPHMQAERALARQWPAASAPATADRATSAGKPDGAGADMASTAGVAAMAGKPGVSVLAPVSAPTRTGKGGQAADAGAPRFEAPATASRTTADPALKGASIAAVTAVGTGKAPPGDRSASSVAGITALQHDLAPAGPAAKEGAVTQTGRGEQAANGDALRFAAPAATNRAAAVPAPKGTPIAAATTVQTGKAPPADPSGAFMARIIASQHGADAVDSAPKAGAAVSAPATKGTGNAAPDANAGVASKVGQALAGQEPGSAGGGSDRRGGDSIGTPVGIGAHKARLDGATPPAAAGGNAPATPLPTAQMFPASGSATSFASALAEGGALARYTRSAAAAMAAGAPAGSLPVQSLSIQLRPVELGAVTANLKYAGSGLTIDIEVQTAEAHRRLSNDSSDIVKSLQSLGFQVDKVTVRQALAQSQPQSQPQNQPQQGQTLARDGSAGGFGSQGGSAFSMSGQSSERQGGGRRQGPESGYEDTSERGVGMVRQTADRLPRRGVFI